MRNTRTVTSADIQKALAHRHQRDFFLTEVKSGSTWSGSGVRILDAVAMRLSYTKPYITGYEVKVTRSDFLRDNKFFTYLPLCHALYVVAPAGVVKREELPTEIGLIWYDANKKTLTTKKKPPARQVEVSTEMLQYIIYSRMESDRIPFYSDKAEYFKAWLDNKLDNQILAQKVKGKLLSEIRRLESELRVANEFQRGVERKQFGELIECFERHGMTKWEHNPVRWAEAALGRQYPQVLDYVQQNLETAIRIIEKEKGATHEQESRFRNGV
jgi:hypothetical protein